MAKPGYGRDHQRARLELLTRDPWCAYCGRPASVADHVPPLSSVPHPDLWRGVLVSSCARCSLQQGGRLHGVRTRRAARPLPRPSRRW